MKRMVVAAVFSLFAVLPTMAQAPPKQKSAAPPAPVPKCRNADGRPCTAKQVRALTDAVFAEKMHHETLAMFEGLTLVAPDGTLKCVLHDGGACTTTQLDLVKEIATGLELYINYTSPKSNSGK